MSEIPGEAARNIDVAATEGGATPDGGAGGSVPGAPIGFTADVGGVPAAEAATDDPEEIDIPDASRHGPVKDSERADSAEAAEADEDGSAG